ncbi:AAA family ATPase [Microbispora sp. NEAU-D428]|uniref:HelD family protein n=1 Tax=Microbispora sitophila TaxID=2771537 RepID=UPI001866D39F|nr:AAA family ATPase [Microbispora sitophila]MBE3012529.1 AAA family ATPase [Microbispora sitophila]
MADDRSVVIAEEQRAVDHAYDCVEQERTAIDRFKNGYRTDCSDANLLSHPDAPPEYGQREDIGHLALVTMRVDLTKDEDDKLTWYLGRRTVRDSARDLVVVKWTSKQATEWRLATSDHPEDVRLLRSLRCDGRKVLDYSDNEIQPLPGSPESPSAAEDRVDPFLLADLDLARDGLMRDIVETIQRDQLRLVSDERRGLLVVQGGPGTGKTAVGLHRVTWLLDNKYFTDDEVLVIGPHKHFLQYVRDVLPRLGTGGVSTLDVAQVWAGEVRGADSPSARLVKSDERMAQVLSNAVRGLIRPDLLPREELAFSFRGATLWLARTELAEFLNEAVDAGGPYLIRRQRFIDRTLDLLMHRYEEATRTTLNDVKFRGQLEKQTDLAAMFAKVWPRTTAEQVLRGLLGDAGAVQGAALGVLTSDEQSEIVRPQAKRVADEPWTAEDLVCLEELRYLLSGEEPQRYKHIVVDEAQDLTPMQARALARRCPSGSMTILGDLAQTTGSRQYDVWGRLAGLLAGPDGWHMAELTTGYRVPTEVMAFAGPLATALSPSTAFPTPIRPPVADALTVTSVKRAKLVEATASAALKLAMRDSARSVAVVVPGAGELLDEIGSAISAAQGSTLPGFGGQITVLPAPLAKGLEFDHVVVVEPQYLAEQGPVGLRQLYVAITRCTQSLTILHSAPLPVELGGPAKAVPPALAHADPMPDVAAGMPQAQYNSRDEFVASLKDRISADRERPGHGWLRHTLMAELLRNELQPSMDSELADITCKTGQGSTIYVVIGSRAARYEELREAAIRALETEWSGGERADEVVLVLPEAPQDLWAVDLLSEALNVSTIWKTPTGWDGPDVNIALGVPPDAN